MNLIIDAALNNESWTSVIGLVSAKMTGTERIWMQAYINHRRNVLSNFTMTDNGVKYYETIQNDEETGNEGELC